MPDKKFELELKIAADVADIKKATAELNVFKERFSTIAGQLKQGFFLNIGAGIGNQIKSVISGALPAYAEAEKAERKLASAMEATGINVRENLESFKKLASQIQSATKIGDEQVAAMQALAINMGVSSDKIGEVVKNAVGLSTALGMDLTTATKAASAAIQGKTELLTRYIPTLSSCKTAEEKYAQVQKLASSGFAQAKAEAETLGGALAQLSNAWSDVSETIGEAAAPVVKMAASILKSLAETINENKTAAIFLTRAVMALIAACALGKLAAFLKTMVALKAAFVANTAAVVADTVATEANTAAKVKAVAAAAALGKATTSVGSAAGSASSLMALLPAALNPATLAIMAAAAAVAYLGYEYGKMRDAQNEAQKSFDNFAEAAEARTKPIIAAMREEGATRDEIMKAEKNALLELEGLYRMHAIAVDEGYDTTAIDNAIGEHKKIYDALHKEAEELVAIRNAKIAAYESAALANISEAKEKHSDTNRNDSQKLARVNEEIISQQRILSDIEWQILNAQGEQKQELSEHYKLETDKLIALEAQQKSLEKSVAAEKKAKADKIAEQEKELNAAAERAVNLQNELSLESRIWAARLSGNEAEAKRLEDEQKISALKNQIVNAEKTQYTTAEALKELEDDAEKRARRRVNLENAALKAEQERARLKNTEKANEDYIWRLKVAQAKLRGDDKEVKRLEEAKAAKGEIDALVAGGMDRKRAQNMVAKTRAAEAAASEAESKRNGGADLRDAEGPRPRRERRPVTATTKRDENGNVANGLVSPLAKFHAENEEWMRKKNPGQYAAMNMPRNGIEPPQPSSEKGVKNPTKEAGGAVDDMKKEDFTKFFTDAKEYWDKFEQTLNDIKNNTAEAVVGKKS